MQSRILILGSGVSAGLAANLLNDKGEIHLFSLINSTASPIPELVPRRPFFDALRLTKEEEISAIVELAPRVKKVTWIEEDQRNSRSLETNDSFFVFEKGSLAEWLRRRAQHAGVTLGYELKQIEIFKYDLLLDCRGARAVALDPGYVVNATGEAVTRCTYAILERPDELGSDEMFFWAASNDDQAKRTFFCVPIGENLISLGCSYSPAIKLDVQEVIGAARNLGISISDAHIKHHGEALPELVRAVPRDARTIPIGEASRTSCPLQEYGIMRALSEILALAGETALPNATMLRPLQKQIDPHFPVELFFFLSMQC